MEYILIIISAIFVNIVVFAQFLGICPFLGVSKKALAIRMKQLGLLENEYLDRPNAIIEI